MTILVTGSSGHLGEALVRTLQAQRREAIGIDILPSAFTHRVGSIADRAFLRGCMKGVVTVLHAATLHKPHVATRSRQDFVDVNITGTLNLLEEAAAASVTAFIYTSTTSVFGDALTPPPGEPAAWVTEDVTQVLAFLSRERRQSRGPRGVCGCQRQGQRVSLSPRRYRGRGQRASPGGRPRTISRFRKIHHQRHDAILAE